MSGYRLYFMDGDQHIRSAKIVESDSDAGAIRIAEALDDGQRMELWSLARLVRRFGPGPDAI